MYNFSSIIHDNRTYSDSLLNNQYFANTANTGIQIGVFTLIISPIIAVSIVCIKYLINKINNQASNLLLLDTTSFVYMPASYLDRVISCTHVIPSIVNLDHNILYDNTCTTDLEIGSMRTSIYDNVPAFSTVATICEQTIYMDEDDYALPIDHVAIHI